MILQKLKLLTIVISSLIYSKNSLAKKYDCSSLSSLQTEIKKDSKDNVASVAASIIRLMGRTPNLCVKNILETSDAVQVRYLDNGKIISDVFNFSKNNQLVSMSRTFSDGTAEIINF